MEWAISLSDQALKFLTKVGLPKEKIFDLIRNAVRKFQGEEVNIELRKLKGEWVNFYRIRKGTLRIIAEFNFDTHSAYIEKIEWRGRAYKR